MTQIVSVNGVALPEEAILLNPGGAQAWPSSAWYGEVSTATLVIDDPFGDYDFRAWDVVTAEEDAATNSRIFTGWIFDMRITRGPYAAGPSRVWELDIVDQNEALTFNYFRANSAQRPAETDVARVEFIIESEPMAWSPVVAGPLTNLTDNPVNLQSYDMVRVTPVEALTTTAGHAGKTFHVFWNHDDAELQLYYDTILNYPAATASISNVIADAGADVYYPFMDASLRRAGDQLYTGELIDFVGGSAFGESATTIDRLSPTPLSPVSFKRMFQRRSDAIGRLETANAIIQSDLASQATEENTIVVTIRVPAANVNDIEAGQRVTVRFTHLPGYETDTDVNCIRRDVALTDGRVDTYDVTLELSDKAKLRELNGDPDVFPPGDPCDVDDLIVTGEAYDIHDTTHDITISPAPQEGQTVVIDVGMRSNTNTSVPDGGWTAATGYLDNIGPGTQDFRMRRYYKVWDEDDDPHVVFTETGSTAKRCIVYKLDGSLTPDASVTGVVTTDNPATMTSGSVTPSGTPAIILAGFLIANDVPNAWTGSAVSPAVEVAEGAQSNRTAMWGGQKTVSTAGAVTISLTDGGHAGIVRGYGTITTAFICEGADPDAPCLSPGQPSPEDQTVTPAPDGVETEFFTTCPFADETLHVRVDATNQDGAVVSYDGAAGSFVLGFAPTPTERITVNYLGRP